MHHRFCAGGVRGERVANTSRGVFTDSGGVALEVEFRRRRLRPAEVWPAVPERVNCAFGPATPPVAI